ncbi:ABC transporter permease [Bailinhaonella thermotolerans]|uniref:FtsX-like permease family protein n=1 Tax=Bailinhaonella thermotolerans TaxID=1070861 RepID=A0A3A4B2H2_9ACTN|nr:FtsX-like permease family protein [Bailinhaonella thermotolerans]RJL32375.1 FtsX-like permease family protein [Bailinhaonella thermotolerans]
MLKTTLAGLRAHKLRLVLTALAITLGVGFVSGTFILTDAMRNGFTQSFAADADKLDVAVTPGSHDPEAPKLDDSVLKKVRAVPGVAEAQGLIQGEAPLIGKDGKAYGDFPTYGVSIVEGRLARTPIEQGRAPKTPGEVVLESTLARNTGFKVGDTVKVLDRKQQPRAFTVVGVFDAGVRQDLLVGGAVGFTHGQARTMTGAKTFEEIDVAASGVAPEELRKRVAGAIGPGHTVETGTQYAERLAKSNGADMEMITFALLLFGLVALLVAALVIYNTFNILIAQRMRELALLRCIGAGRSQIFGSVLLESVVVGVIASVTGLAVGIGMAAGAMAILKQVGEDMPISGLPISPRTIIVALAVGVIVTVVSALLPARGATRVAPIAALRTQVEEPGFRAGVVRIVFATLFLLAGLAATALGVTMEPGAAALMAVAGGGVLVFAAVLIAGPIIVRPLGAAVGWLPRKLFGVPGRLAVGNAHRNPKRAATTTIALTVGVTLMTLISVVGSSTKATVTQQLAEQFPMDFVVQGQFGTEAGIPRAFAESLKDKPELGAVVAQRRAEVDLGGSQGTVGVGSVSSDALGTHVKPQFTQGTLADFKPGTVAVSTDVAKSLGRLGDTFSLPTPTGKARFRISATFDAEKTELPAITLVDTDFARLFPKVDDALVMIKVKDGVPTAKARAVVEAAAQPYPTAKLASMADVRSQFNEIFDTMLLIVAGLLGLAIVISLLGIANTLTLSVVERTRESALLRALGLTARQLRRMLSIEALILGVIGALVGVALGSSFGWAATQTLDSDAVFDMPVGQVLLFIVVAAAAGVLAGVLPARRAAKASIVESLASE